MKLLMLLAVVVYAGATPLLGSNKCTWGPGYWCSHVSNAKQCQAMDHCLDTFWPKQQIRTASSASCSVCKMAIGELRQNLKNHETEKDVSSFLARFCTVLPADEKRKCKLMATDYLPEVMQLLKSEISSEVVCDAIDFCKAEDVNRKIPTTSTTTTTATTTAATTPSPGKICTDCKTLVQDVKDIMTDNDTIGETIQMFEQVICANMGPLRSICRELVEKYVPMYFQALSKFIEPDMICAVLGFCQNGDPLENNLYLREKLVIAMQSVIRDTSTSNDSCQICKTFATDLQNLIKDKNIQSTIVQFVETNICSRLGKLSSVCKLYVDQYQSLFFDALVSMMVPETICEDLKLCLPAGAVSESNARFAVQAAILRPDDMLVKYKAEIPMQKLVPAKVKLQASAECEVCKLLMKELKEILGKNKTEEAIMKALDEVCDIFPGDLKTECLALVDVYGSQIVKMILDNVDFDQICIKLKFCSETDMSKVIALPKVEAGVCDACELVLTIVKNLVVANKTEDEMVAELKQICSLIPSELKDQCDLLIDTYGKLIIDFIDQIEPHTLCASIGMCPSTRKYLDVQCTLCELVISQLASSIQNNRSEVFIKEQLEKVCSLLPSIRDECDAFITLYEAAIIDLLVQELDSDKICKILNLCSGQHGTWKPPQPKSSDNDKLYYKQNVLGGEECTHGPSFWCASHENARKCNAEEYCVRAHALP